jgi:hypothetical protein
MNVLDTPPGRESAGHERTRVGLWGSPCLVSLCAPLLPSLAEGGLYVAQLDLDLPEADCVLVMNNLAAISAATDYGDEYIADRVGNIQDAIARARAVDGRVVIW